MKIDKEKLRTMAKMQDNELWCNIKSIAKEHGLSLPEKTPSHAEMEKLRTLMLSDRINLPSAMRMVNEFKKGAK